MVAPPYKKRKKQKDYTIEKFVFLCLHWNDSLCYVVVVKTCLTHRLLGLVLSFVVSLNQKPPANVFLSMTGQSVQSMECPLHCYGEKTGWGG